MRIVKRFFLLMIAAAATPIAAAAQNCLGLPSFSSGTFRINGSMEFPNELTTVYGLGLGAGRTNSAFGNIGAGHISFDNPDGKSNFGFVEGGYQIPVSRLQICPVAGVTFGSGPNDDDIGFKQTYRSLAGGLAAGYATGGTSVQLIPNAAIKYQFGSTKFEEEGLASVTEDFDGGVIDLGLGLVFINRFTIQPLFHIPFGGEEDESSFGFFASIAFGPRGK